MNFLPLVCCLLFLVLVSYIPIRLAIAAYQVPQPQAILVLGGRSAREEFTAEFAALHPELEIWISSGMRPNEARNLFYVSGIPEAQLHLDYRAVDTVTNFTTLVKDLNQQHIQHIYLITSDYHMPRAVAIATVVLGSHGITFTPIAVPSSRPPESTFRIVRDVGRSMFWLITGQTGASLNPKFRQSSH